MTNEVMTIKEASKYLKVTRQTLMKMIKQGKIPANKIGRVWRILKRDIDNYISQIQKPNN